MQSEQVVLLTFVSNRQDIRGSLCTFNRDLQQYHQLARDLLRRTTFWVYDPVQRLSAHQNSLALRV